MRAIAGHMSSKFDYQMLYRYSLRHGVKIPFNLQPYKRSLPKCFLDTNDIYGAGEFNYFIKLETLAKVMGYKGDMKNGRSGKDFYKFTEDEKESYLSADLKMTRHVFDKLNDALDLVDDAVIFDIETRPRDSATISSMIPAFNAADVKLGNIKDPYKIEEKIKSAESNHLKSHMDKAQLVAEFSELCAIGFQMPDGHTTMHFCNTDEEIVESLDRFWDIASAVQNQNEAFFNNIKS